MEKKYRRLRPFNLAMAGLHFAQGMAMLWLSSDFALPIKTSFLGFDPATRSLAPDYTTVYNLPIGPMVALFLFLSAAAHLIVSLPGVFEWYVKNLGKGINYARWVEYSFSASVMIVIIAMLVGMYDIVTLIFIFALNAAMILFGWMMELHNQTTKKVNWTAFIFGSIVGIVPWIGVAMFLIGDIESDAKPPTFVYWIFFSIFLFFNVFAINQVLQYKKVGKWRDYLYGEYTYIVLSLVAKSLLAWQVWAGTLRPV